MALRLPEQKLWDKMRKALGDFRTSGVYLERVENLVSVGIPDVLACTPELGGFFVELKAQDRLPARDTSKVLGTAGLNPHQRNWHLNWRRAGGRSYILIGVEQSEFLLMPGPLHDVVNDMTIHELRCHAAAIGWRGIADHFHGAQE